MNIYKTCLNIICNCISVSGLESDRCTFTSLILCHENIFKMSPPSAKQTNNLYFGHKPYKNTKIHTTKNKPKNMRNKLQKLNETIRENILIRSTYIGVPYEIFVNNGIGF